MSFIGILFFILGIGMLGYAYYRISNQNEIDLDIQQKNKQLHDKYSELVEQKNDILLEINKLKDQEQEATNKMERLNALTSSMNETAAAAFSKYVDALEDAYKNKEIEFETDVELLDNSYMNMQEDYLKKIDSVKQDLEKISTTRAAALEAQLREEEIKKEKEFYALNIPLLNLKDVKILREIEPKLNNPRVLRMLIWQNFYRSPMNELCARVLGTEQRTGIYKITNQATDLCYIGQAINIAQRWKDHAKHGLGIDTPGNNKMYKYMEEYGLENFTWELLEECPREQLNEKEKFYIDLYQSDIYGMNMKGGNNT